MAGPQRSRTRRLARRLALVGLSLALATAAAEVLVRRWHPVAVTGIRRESVRLSENPRLMYDLDPEWPDHNALGLRGPAPEAAEPAGARRVLVLGDSLAYGLGVDAGETLAAQLERELRAAGGRVQVLNGGVPGYSIVQEAEWLAARGLALAPDALVLVVCLNDWTAYTVEFDALIATRADDERRFLSLFYDPARSRLAAWLTHSHLWRHLTLLRLERGWIETPSTWTATTEREGQELVQETSVKEHFAERDFYGEHFGRLARTAREHGLPLVCVLVPIGRAGYEETYAARHAELEPLCAAAGAELVDLPAFARAERAGVEPWWQGLYHTDDALHPNAAGFAVLARALAGPVGRALAEER